MSKQVFLVTPYDDPSSASLQAADAKQWLNGTLADIARVSKRQVVVIIEVCEL